MKYRFKAQWIIPVVVLAWAIPQARAGLSPELQKCSDLLNEVVVSAVRYGKASKSTGPAGAKPYLDKMQSQVEELVAQCFKYSEGQTFVGEGIVGADSANGLMFSGQCRPQGHGLVYIMNQYDDALEAAKQDGLLKCLNSGFTKDQCKYQGADNGAVLDPDPNAADYPVAEMRCRVRAYFKGER